MKQRQPCAAIAGRSGRVTWRTFSTFFPTAALFVSADFLEVLHDDVGAIAALAWASLAFGANFVTALPGVSALRVIRC
jgi:hypothetical protein